MSGQFDARTVQGFWTDIQKATPAQSTQPADGQAQRSEASPSVDSPQAQAARSALLASLTAAGFISQTGIPMYPPPQFDSANLTPQALSRVEDMLPIGAQQLQQPQAAGQLQATSGRLEDAEAAQLPIVQPPPPHPSGSDSDDDARGRSMAANGDRKSQLKEKNRKAQKRFRERQKVSSAACKTTVHHYAVV